MIELKFDLDEYCERISLSSTLVSHFRTQIFHPPLQTKFIDHLESHVKIIEKRFVLTDMLDRCIILL